MHVNEGMMFYTTSMESVLWGAALIAVTMWMHGTGMQLTMTMVDAVRRSAQSRRLRPGVGTVVLASLMIVFVHLLEVLVWALFMLGSNAIQNPHAAFYFALMQYTTVGSELHLPQHWRLLEGMIAIAGLMTFAWSTGVLFAMAQEEIDRQQQRGAVRQDKPAAAAPDDDRTEGR